jgi:hypothetical protein
MAPEAAGFPAFAVHHDQGRAHGVVNVAAVQAARVAVVFPVCQAGEDQKGTGAR